MKIRVLGTRGEIDESAPWHTRHSGVLVDDTFLLDLGEEEYLKYRPSFIVFTHFHPDHAYFVRPHEELTHPVEAYGPDAAGGLEGLQVKTTPFSRGGYRFTPVPTIHSLKVASQAYIVEKNGKRFLYTGDLAWMEKKYQQQLGDLDMVITEGSFLQKGGMIRRDKESGKIFGHTGVPDLIRIFSRHTGRIVLMHFGSWFMEDVEQARKKIGELVPADITVEVARDGQEFTV